MTITYENLQKKVSRLNNYYISAGLCLSSINVSLHDNKDNVIETLKYNPETNTLTTPKCDLNEIATVFMLPSYITAGKEK